MINNNPKYQQPPPNYNTNGNGNIPQIPRNNVVHGAAIPSGGISNNQQMQQQLQQKYYDQYENYARPANGNNNNNGHNGMTQSQNMKMAYGHPQQQQQMTASYNQQMNYYNQQHQNGGGVGKISDYDPITDSPRNIPQAGRQNQTLIYSSDRAASK